MLIAIFFAAKIWLLPLLLATTASLIETVMPCIIVVAGIAILFASVGIRAQMHARTNIWTVLFAIITGLFALARLIFDAGVRIARAVYRPLYARHHPFIGFWLAVLAVLLYI